MLRRKMLYIICLIGVIGLNIFYYEYQVFLLLCLIVVIPLISWILYIISSMGMKLSLIVDKSTLRKNDVVRVRLGRKKRLNFCLAKGRVKLKYRYSQTETVFEKIIDVSEGIGSRAGTFGIKAEHCGYMYINIEWIDMYDYFKLFHTLQRFDGQISVCVMPEIESYDDDLREGASGKISDEIEIPAPGRSEEILDLREFRDGDSVRDIHWKRSASVLQDEYIVKEYLNNSDIILNIVVDIGLYKYKKFRTGLDYVYKEALICGLAYARRGGMTAFVVWDDEKSEVRVLRFNDEESCVSAFRELMLFNCSENALEKACQALLDVYTTIQSEPLIISNKGYEI